MTPEATQTQAQNQAQAGEQTSRFDAEAAEAVQVAEQAVRASEMSNNELLSSTTVSSHDSASMGRSVHLAPRGTLTIDVKRNDPEGSAGGASVNFVTPKKTTGPKPNTRVIRAQVGGDNPKIDSFIEVRRHKPNGEMQITDYSGEKAKRLGAASVKAFAKQVREAAGDVETASDTDKKSPDVSGVHLYT